MREGAAEGEGTGSGGRAASRPCEGSTGSGQTGGYRWVQSRGRDGRGGPQGGR